MDTESGIKGKVLSLVTKDSHTKAEEFLAFHLKNLRETPKDQQPTNILLIEYKETEEMSDYTLYIGGRGSLRPHHLIGILYCLADDVAGKSNV